MQKAGQCNFLHRQEKKKKEIEPRKLRMCKYIKEKKFASLVKNVSLHITKKNITQDMISITPFSRQNCARNSLPLVSAREKKHVALHMVLVN